MPSENNLKYTPNTKFLEDQNNLTYYLLTCPFPEVENDGNKAGGWSLSPCQSHLLGLEQHRTPCLGSHFSLYAMCLFHSWSSHELQSFRYLLALLLASSKPCISHCDAQDEAVESLQVPAWLDTTLLQAGQCARCHIQVFKRFLGS